MSMGRFYQLSLVITTALIILFSAGCSGSARYGHSSYSRAGSVNVAAIQPQPIPVVSNGSLGRQPGYTLVELVPAQRNASDGRMGRNGNACMKIPTKIRDRILYI